MRLYIQLGDVHLGYVAAQVGILLLQKRLGARWFIPWAPWQSIPTAESGNCIGVPSGNLT